jgi:hypothetical protein
MDDLNAQQIVLLTLLVSFVTSIATGITTVSLLEQAPEPITQTINRVVEKTVERVIEVKDDNNEEKPVERIIETVIVNAEDLTIDAIQKNSDSIVRIYSRVGNNRAFVAMGVIVSKNGKVLSDSNNIFQGGEYIGIYSNGEKDLKLSFRESNNPFAVLEIQGDNTETFVPASFGDSQGVKLGQSVISLAGQKSNYVSTGIITSLDKDEIPSDPNNSASQPVTTVKSINTSISSDSVLDGSVLLNLKGEIIGIKINTTIGGSNSFVPSSNVKSFINYNSSVVAVAE